jgi:hypothetical protein
MDHPESIAWQLGPELFELQELIGEMNAQKGFHRDSDNLKRDLREAVGIEYVERERALRMYWSEKLMLIVSEAAEAQEELRHGHAVDETWHSMHSKAVRRGTGDFAHLWESVDQFEDENGISGPEFSASIDQPAKPEGVPSEIADIVIRCFDFADEAGFDLGEIILEKLRYNATRPAMHGGKAF